MAKSLAKQTISYICSHVRRYSFYLVIIMSFISLATVLGSIVYALLYKELIDLITEFVGDDRRDIFPQAIKYITILAIVYFVEIISWRIAGFTNNHFQPSIMRDMSNDIFTKLHHHSIGFFANNFIGSLVTKSKRLIHGFERIADLIYWEFLPIKIVLIFSTIVLFTVDSLLGWILLVWGIVFLGATSIFSLWKLKYDLKVAEADSDVTGSFADSLTNFYTVKIFSHLPHEKIRFNRSTQDQKKIRKFNWDLIDLSEIFQALMMLGLEITLLYFCVVFWLEEKITVGDVVLVNSLSIQIMRRIWNFGKRVRDLVTAFADCKEMTDLLFTPYEIVDPEEPEESKITKGKIDFQSVYFAYEDEQYVFEDFDLEIKAGEKIGLVGESGSGKSTFTKLMFRFNDVNSGQILIDGQDISKVTQNDLRKNIAFVPQEPILFHRSLKENIRYGNLEASDEEVMEAAKNAHADEFISKTKHDYKTLVGERGIKLSGGEKQRIAIARAMLSRSPILILDEATSALDSKAEDLIQKALESLMKDRTTIVIAHRLSTLRKMDRILVLEEGKIVEQGSHADLVKLDGKYAELWNHQVGGFI